MAGRRKHRRPLEKGRGKLLKQAKALIDQDLRIEGDGVYVDWKLPSPSLPKRRLSNWAEGEEEHDLKRGAIRRRWPKPWPGFPNPIAENLLR
jgi:hypothetical protein